MSRTHSKAELRQLGLAARRNLATDERLELSLRITEHVCRSGFFHAALRIGCYLPLPDEVGTWPLIERAWRRNKRVFVPVLEKNFRMTFVQLSSDTGIGANRFGILEPVDGPRLAAQKLDVVFMPVVAFDDQGNRIGMGGGYYDRALARGKHRPRHVRPKRIGLAFACQQVAGIRASYWDIPLFRVFTENGPVR